MSSASSRTALPTLPQQDSPDAQQARAFQLSMARTDYNYMLSYMDSVPLSADLPTSTRCGRCAT